MGLKSLWASNSKVLNMIHWLYNITNSSQRLIRIKFKTTKAVVSETSRTAEAMVPLAENYKLWFSTVAVYESHMQRRERGVWGERCGG
jgi:hypothetical protein